MRILVTGHNGYLGSVLAPVLQAEGYDVMGLDTGYFESCTFGGEAPPVVWIRKDIREIAMEDLRGVEAVVHLAALCNDPLGDLDPVLTDQINYQASLRLAVIAKAAGVSRFLFSSSCSLYGAAGEEACVTEEASLDPLTPYAVSKVRTEAALAQLADAGFSPVSLRNATVYGVSPRLRIDLVLNNLVGWARVAGEIRLMSDGSPWRPLVHVRDVAEAFRAVLAAPREAVHNQAFNVGVPGENYRVRDLASLVQSACGCPVSFAPSAGPDARNYRVEFAKFQQAVPGFRPRWNVRLGVQELFQAFREAGFTAEEFHSGRYVRLAQIKRLLQAGSLDQTLKWHKAPALVHTEEAH